MIKEYLSTGILRKEDIILLTKCYPCISDEEWMIKNILE